MLRRRLARALLAMTVGASSPASEWTPVPAPASSVPAGTCIATAWTATIDGGPARSFTSTSLVLAAGMRLKLVAQATDESKAARSVAKLMRDEGALAAINGGYYAQEFTPVGLFRVGGRELSPVNDEAALSGFLAIDEKGAVTLRRRGDDLASAVAVRQAGPFVIDPGGALGIRPSQQQPARRTVVVLAKDGRLALVVASGVALYDLARCLHDHPDGFGVGAVERALSLDGGPSTAMSVRGLSEEDVQVEKAPVRDAVLVVPAPR